GFTGAGRLRACPFLCAEFILYIANCMIYCYPLGFFLFFFRRIDYFTRRYLHSEIKRPQR
ncbi:hypothetical protein, partial [Serratia sp. CY43514]|uniref:hypothetical protein n=1 Tax=Serratia sp. CY43514 TaxID=3383620 RepID=UPI004027143F